MKTFKLEDMEDLMRMEEELGILKAKMRAAWKFKDPAIFRINRGIREMMIQIENQHLKMIGPESE